MSQPGEQQSAGRTPGTGPDRPAIRILGLETRFGDALIHTGLDLTVPRGGLVGIVGSSGCGKTVLLREMVMLLRPSAGRIELLGKDIGRLDAAQERALKRRLGIMFQGGALFTGLSVLENVCLPLREHTRLGNRVIRELGMLKIGLAGLDADAASKHPSELSGGMVKRAALARALALDPELLFLDEPTSGLDPVGASAFDELILELRENLGLTVVMVTHDVDSLWRTTDAVAFLSRRRVLAMAPVAELAELDEPEIQRYFGGARMQRASALSRE